MATDGNEPREPAAEQSQTIPQQKIEVDESAVGVTYTNFCRVTSTPEEVILDLGLNSRPLQPEESVVTINERVIMNHYTAKRLMNVLGAALQRHEQTFGPLQVNVQDRVQSPK